MHIRALAATTTLGSPVFSMAKRNQTIHPFASSEDDVSAVTTVAATGAAILDILFAAERYAAVAALAGFDFDFRAINKHDLTDWDKPKNAPTRGLTPYATYFVA